VSILDDLSAGPGYQIGGQPRAVDRVWAELERAATGRWGVPSRFVLELHEPTIVALLIGRATGG
jgi:hypothetical protein